MAVSRALAVLAVLAVATGPARAQAPEEPVELKSPSEILRASMDAAGAGDWATVARLTDALLGDQLAVAELAEAHRLAGLAAFFQGDKPRAEGHFLAYLKIDLDGALDAALYPPDVIVFFSDVKAKYAAELRARRPKPPHYYWQIAWVPAVSQFQNRETTKGALLLAGMGALLATNLGTFVLLRSWCDEDRTCHASDGSDRSSAASKVRVINVASGIGFVAVAVYAAVDGVRGYRRITRERPAPYVSSSENGAFFGVAGAF